MGYFGTSFNLEYIVTPQIEQSSEVLAEDNLPIKIPKHVEQCWELTRLVEDAPAPVVRCIYYHDGRVSLVVLLAEIRDSFLVGAAARLVMLPSGEVNSEPVSSEPVIRTLKSSISYVTTASNKSKYHYYMFLRDQGIHYLPDYLTEEVLVIINNYIKTYEFENNLDLQKAGPVFNKLNIKGTSKFAFKSHIISEKIH